MNPLMTRWITSSLLMVFFLAIVVFPSQAAQTPLATASALLPPDEVKARVDEIRDLDAEYTSVQNRLVELKKVLPSWVRQTRNNRADRGGRMSDELVRLRAEYLELKEKEYFLAPIFGLKEAMNQTYLAVYPDIPPEAKKLLNDESSRLALGLAVEVARLREEVYHSNTMPILHNMMISVSLKPRGACKHWAEDLLAYLSRQPRQFFSVTWGQAHGGKYTEHNTAVLLPRDAPFEKGLVVDPWRTSGKIYWTWTTRDKHYPWKWWSYYGIQ